jgi:hypothetical protein
VDGVSVEPPAEDIVVQVVFANQILIGPGLDRYPDALARLIANEFMKALPPDNAGTSEAGIRYKPSSDQSSGWTGKPPSAVVPVPTVRFRSAETRILPSGSGVDTVGEFEAIVGPPANDKLTKLASNRVLVGIVAGKSYVNQK